MTPEEKRKIAEQANLLFLANEIQMRAVANIKELPLRQSYKQLFGELWKATGRFTRHVRKAFAGMEKAKEAERGSLEEAFDNDVDELEELIYKFLKDKLKEEEKL